MTLAFSALFKRSVFREFSRKMRRAPPSRESFPPFGNDSRILHAALQKTTHPKMGAVWLECLILVNFFGAFSRAVKKTPRHGLAKLASACDTKNRCRLEKQGGKEQTTRQSAHTGTARSGRLGQRRYLYE
ncbi:MAG: hypothetical protein H7834_11105 [Magnetococcus sp. YQC-9]